jgi:hypothetical protein
MEKGLMIPQKERTKTTNSILVSLMNQLEKVGTSVCPSLPFPCSLGGERTGQLLCLMPFRSTYYTCVTATAILNAVISQ